MVARSLTVAVRLHKQVRDLDGGAVAADYDQTGFGDVVVDAVAFEVVANHGVFGSADVLIENGAADFGATADVAVVEDHALVDLGAGMDAHAAADDGVA